MKFKNILLIVLFFITMNVYAVDNCTNSEMKRLKELASNVKFKYITSAKLYDEYYEVLYKIEIINTNDDLKIYYNTTGNKNDNKLIEEINNEIFYENEVIYFSIYSYTNNLCTDELLKSKSLKLPIYNYYYLLNKDKCIEYPDFKYCKEYMDTTDIDTDEIDKLFSEYLDENNDSNISIKVKKYYWYIIASIIFILGILVILIVKKKKNKENDI